MAAVALMSDVCRATTTEERTPILVAFNISQQVYSLIIFKSNVFNCQLKFDIDWSTFGSGMQFVLAGI